MSGTSALYNNTMNSGLLSTTGGSTTATTTSTSSTQKSGQGWQTFLNNLPGILGAVGNTVVGVKAAEAEKEKAKNGFLNSIGLGGYYGQPGNGGNNNAIIWIVGGLLVVGVAVFMFMKKGKGA